MYTISSFLNKIIFSYASEYKMIYLMVHRLIITKSFTQFETIFIYLTNKINRSKFDFILFY